MFPLDSTFQGDTTAYLSHGMKEEFEYARKRGYLRFVAAEPSDVNPSLSPYQPPIAPVRSSYKATFKGAYLMTWKELWPFKSVIRSLRSRHDRRLLEATDFRVA